MGKQFFENELMIYKKLLTNNLNVDVRNFIDEIIEVLIIFIKKEENYKKNVINITKNFESRCSQILDNRSNLIEEYNSNNNVKNKKDIKNIEFKQTLVKINNLYKKLLIIFENFKQENSIYEHISNLTEFINNIIYLDSLILLLNKETYEISDHDINELRIRKFFFNKLKQGIHQINIGEGFILYIFDKNSFSNIDFKNPISFNETKRMNMFFEKYLKFGFNLEFFFKKLDFDIKKYNCSKDKGINFFKNKFFFNLDSYYIFLKEPYEDNLKNISSEKDFVNKIINFLIYVKFKDKTFESIFNTISEVNMLKLRDAFRFRFLSYSKAREMSKKIAFDFLKKELEQGDITKADYFQVKQFINSAYLELKLFQDEISELKNKDIKKKYSQFIKNNLLVHNFMMYLLRVAILAEGRSLVNNKLANHFMGRENGFEGSNTIAAHTFNDSIKYKVIFLNIIRELKKSNFYILENFNFNIERFKVWLAIILHDFGTYDLQNAIPFGDSIYSENNIKKAHNLIGAFNIRETPFVKGLFFSSKNIDDLNFMSGIINYHDYSKIQLDINYFLTQNLRIENIYNLLAYTITGIADNSAGISVIDFEEQKVLVDIWEEKGASLFNIKDLIPYYFNVLEFFYLMKREPSRKEYYKNEINKKIDFIKKYIFSYSENLKKLDGDSIEFFKLFDGIEENEDILRAILSTSGVINSGILEFKSYDGKTLELNIILDEDITNILVSRIGFELTYGRIIKFIEPYSNYLVGGEKNLNEVIKTGVIEIYNSDVSGKIIHNSVGLRIYLRYEKDIVNKYVFEKYSKNIIEFVLNLKTFSKVA